MNFCGFYSAIVEGYMGLYKLEQSGDYFKINFVVNYLPSEW